MTERIDQARILDEIQAKTEVIATSKDSREVTIEEV